MDFCSQQLKNLKAFNTRAMSSLFLPGSALSLPQGTSLAAAKPSNYQSETAVHARTTSPRFRTVTVKIVKLDSCGDTKITFLYPQQGKDDEEVKSIRTKHYSDPLPIRIKSFLAKIKKTCVLGHRFCRSSLDRYLIIDSRSICHKRQNR